MCPGRFLKSLLKRARFDVFLSVARGRDLLSMGFLRELNAAENNYARLYRDAPSLALKIHQSYRRLRISTLHRVGPRRTRRREERSSGPPSTVRGLYLKHPSREIPI